MKKTQFIDIITTIKRTIVVFFSIIMFVSISIGIYTGFSWSSKAVLVNLDTMIEGQKLHDEELYVPFGVTEDEIKRISEIDLVNEIEGTRITYQTTTVDAKKYQLKVTQINDIMDICYVVKGHMPSTSGEIAIEEHAAARMGLDVGDTITFNTSSNSNTAMYNNIKNFDKDNDDISSLTESDETCSDLVNNKYVITALVNNPECTMNSDGWYGYALTNGLNINGYAYVLEEAFNKDLFEDYNVILIRSNSLRGYDTSSTEYNKGLDALKMSVQTLIDDIKNERNSTITENVEWIKTSSNNALEELRNKIADGEKKLEDGEKVLEDAENDLQDGKDVLADLQKQYDDGVAELSKAKAELDSIKKSLDEAESQLKYAKAEITAKQEEINKADDEITAAKAKAQENDNKLEAMYTLLVANPAADWTEYNTAKASNEALKAQIVEQEKELVKAKTQLAVTTNELDKKETELKDRKEVYKSALSDYNAGQDKLSEAEADIEDGKRQIADAEKEISANKKKIEDAKAEIAEGNEKYLDTKKQLEDFEDKTESLGDISYITLTRNHNSGVQVMNLFSKIMKNERYSMASLFLIIGILVCYFAILRIVNDQVVLIGTQKANGFYKKEILTKYLLYTGIAIVIGCIIGAFAGKYIVEYVICSALKECINVREVKTIMQVKDILVIAALEIGLLLFVAWLATLRILKRNAIELLNGETAKVYKGHYYEKFKLWKKLSLFSKIIISNFFTDKRRVLGTFVGIAGCTSLLVTAFTMKNNITNSFSEQYKQYYHFDTTISFDKTDEKAADSIRAILDDYGLDYTEVFSSSVAVNTPDDNVVSGSVWVPMNYETFSDIVYVEPDDNSNKDTNSGIWMSSAYGNYYGKNAGNQFRYSSGDGTEIVADIDGYFVNYLNGLQLIMDKNTYYDNYGYEAKGNCFLVNCEPLGRDQLNRALSELEVNYIVREFKEISYGTFYTFEMVSKNMVLVYVFLAIVMAFLVILNLLTMFIDEKRRELIVLMINGYSIKVAKKYITSDTWLLTILGIIGGEILGCIIGNISVQGFYTATTKFMLAVDWQAILIGIVGTATISFVMCQIAVRRVSKFKLADINK
ncbi:MAG: FtsX-like permease family protein [Eubacterium sp.]